MEFQTVIDIFFQTLDIIAKLSLLAMIFVGWKKMRTPRQFQRRDILKDAFLNTVGLASIFMFVGEWPTVHITIGIFCIGIAAGIVTSLPTKIFYDEQGNKYTLGTNAYLLVWMMSLLILEIFETFDFGFKYQMYLVALFSLAMLYGAGLHIFVMTIGKRERAIQVFVE